MEKKKSRKLYQQLTKLTGQTDTDMYGMGKLSELGLMTAGITHEIGNPLAVIHGRSAQLLRSENFNDKDKVEKGLLQIKSSADRIATIIQSVREYIYRNEDSVEEFIPLQEIIDNVLVFCGQRLKNHGVELRIKDVKNKVVAGHKGQYEQAILNLINNSFDAIDHLTEKWIEVYATHAENKVQIFFIDSGKGIPVDVRDKMLDPFYSTKEGKGTGLGLTLVKGIAQNHGGDLTYVEAPNTTFLLELPEGSAISYQQ